MTTKNLPANRSRSLSKLAQHGPVAQKTKNSPKRSNLLLRSVRLGYKIPESLSKFGFVPTSTIGRTLVVLIAFVLFPFYPILHEKLIKTAILPDYTSLLECFKLDGRQTSAAAERFVPSLSGSEDGHSCSASQIVPLFCWENIV